MLYVLESSTCCSKNLLPFLFLLFWSNVWRKPIIGIFGTCSWRTKEAKVMKPSFLPNKPNYLNYACIYLTFINIMDKDNSSNLPAPTSSSDMVINSGSSNDMGRIEIGFWPLPIASCNLSRRLMLFSLEPPALSR